MFKPKPKPKPAAECQHCGLTGHTIDNCRLKVQGDRELENFRLWQEKRDRLKAKYGKKWYKYDRD